VRPNLRAHIRQLQGYLDRYADDIDSEPGSNGSDGVRSGWDSITGVLLYPQRPTDVARLQLIDEAASHEAIMVAWYNETDWGTGSPASTPM
jgi:hypothetical protein